MQSWRYGFVKAVCNATPPPALWKKWIKSGCTQESYPSAGEMDEPSAKMGLYIKLYSTFPSLSIYTWRVLFIPTPCFWRRLEEVIEFRVNLNIYIGLGTPLRASLTWDSPWESFRLRFIFSCFSPHTFLKGQWKTKSEIGIRSVIKRCELEENVNSQINISFIFWYIIFRWKSN